MASSEYKIVFTGTMGAGKTTAIRALSEVEPVATEVRNSETDVHAKATTTAAFDYGELTLEGGDRLRLYGTPGQRRFRFMWSILARGALGVVILVDNSRPDPLADLEMYLENFDAMVEMGRVAVGIGRTDTHPEPAIDAYYERLQQRGLALPLVAVDVRQKEDVLLLVETILGLIEAGVFAADAHAAPAPAHAYGGSAHE